MITLSDTALGSLLDEDMARATSFYRSSDRNHTLHVGLEEAAARSYLLGSLVAVHPAHGDLTPLRIPTKKR